MSLRKRKKDGAEARVTRVLIAEDEPSMRQAVVGMLAREPDFEVVGQAADAAEAVALGAALQPDLALVDVRMPAGGGPRATEGILQRSPKTRIMAFTASQESRDVMEMLSAGAWGYVVKGSPGPEILDAVRRVARGESILSPSVNPDIQLEQ